MHGHVGPRVCVCVRARARAHVCCVGLAPGSTPDHVCTCARLPVVQVEHKAEKTSVDMLVELNKNNVALVSEFKVFNKAFIAAQVAAANATKAAEVTQLQLVQQAASGECHRSNRGACGKRRSRSHVLHVCVCARSCDYVQPAAHPFPLLPALLSTRTYGAWATGDSARATAPLRPTAPA